MPPRACLKIGDVSGSEGFWAAGKQFFRRNPGGFQGKIAPSRGQKDPPVGHVDIFQTSPKHTNLKIEVFYFLFPCLLDGEQFTFVQK